VSAPVRSISLKPGFGPTLPELLAPRWRRASPLMRGLCVALAILVVALAGVLALMLRNRSYSHGGPVPFSFSYRNMERTAPEPGGYVKLVHYVHGRLEDSFAVAPLRLGHYRGKLQLELLFFANTYIRRLERTVPGFRLYGQGKTPVPAGLPRYQVLYETTIAGRRMYGRNVLVFPQRPGAHMGLVIAMLSSTVADEEITSPLRVGSTGLLYKPLHSFTVG
jgi:hypothetical protein